MIKKNKYEISFLVPTLGTREVELRRLFESFVRQTVTNFEVVIVVQDNFKKIDKLCSEYEGKLEICIIKSNEKGLSKARNKGLEYCSGEIIVLSDDDCWYPDEAAQNIVSIFKRNDIHISLTQIFDLNNNRLYKEYGESEKVIKSEFELLSRSSIEIAFKKDVCEQRFDELFGLGACYVCCEEVDFLTHLYRKRLKIGYYPFISVYHDKKVNKRTDKQIEAKGAMYAKNYNILLCILICIRDLVFKKENNWKNIICGYCKYKQYKRQMG